MRRTLLAAMLFLAAGCSSGQTGSVKLIPTANSSTAAVMSSATVADSGSTASGNTIGRVRILLNELEVNTSAGDAGAPGPGGGGPCGGHGGHGGHGGPGGGHPPGGDADKTQQGPFVLTLTADQVAAGTPTAVEMSDVPAGTYDTTEIEIAPYGTDPDGRTMPTTADYDDFRTAAKNTVIVNGTWNGAAYTYAASISVEQETVGSITVSASTPVQLNFVLDASKWFKAADGSDLDPTVAANHDAIAANIKASLAVGNDDDTANHNH